MTRKVVAAILMSAVMVIVASAQLAVGDSREIVKSDGGPNANAVSWEYLPSALGNWSGHIVNNGLRWLVVEVYDNSTGTLEEIMHQKIRFAEYGAYPTGEVDTKKIAMSPTHKYVIIVTPQGPKGASCTFYDAFKACSPPVPVFAITVDGLNVTFEATGSYDPDGTIVSYEWAFGDGTVAYGYLVMHTYAVPGIYVITLTTTDNDGLTTSTSGMLDLTSPVPNRPPAARFSGSSDWYTRTVVVDASASHDHDGYIIDYQWNWGDGTPNGTGKTATHVYSWGGCLLTLTVTDNDGATSSVDAVVFFGPPTEAELILFGYTYAANDSTVLTDCDVTIANLMTGDVIRTYSDEYGYYWFQFGFFVTSAHVGDVIQVTATKDNLSGTNSAVVTWENMWPGYLWLDVYLAAGA